MRQMLGVSMLAQCTSRWLSGFRGATCLLLFVLFARTADSMSSPDGGTVKRSYSKKGMLRADGGMYSLSSAAKKRKTLDGGVPKTRRENAFKRTIDQAFDEPESAEPKPTRSRSKKKPAVVESDDTASTPTTSGSGDEHGTSTETTSQSVDAGVLNSESQADSASSDGGAESSSISLADLIAAPPEAVAPQAPQSSTGAPVLELPGISVRAGGYVFEEGRIDIEQNDSSGESKFESWTRGFASAEAQIGTQSKIRVAAAFDFFAQDRSGTAQGTFTPNLDEVWYSFVSDIIQVKLGNQIIAWGVMDSLSPENQFNPVDLRFLTTKARDEGVQRIPVWAARVLLPVTSTFTFEFAFVPFATPNRYATVGTDFSLLRPGLMDSIAQQYSERVEREVELARRPYFAAVTQALRELAHRNPSSELQGRGLGIVDDRMPDGVARMEGGARMTGSVGRFDFGVSGLTAHERIPRVTLAPVMRGMLFDLKSPPATALADGSLLARNLIQMEFPRYVLGGADLGLRLGPVIMRLEGAYRTLATYYTADFEPVSMKQIEVAAHFEVAWGSAFSMVVEAEHRRVLGDTNRLILFRDNNLKIIAHLQSSLLRDRLHLELSGAYQLGFEDYLVSPHVAYDLTDRFTLALGLVYFGGPKVVLNYDVLRNPDELIKVNGGALSYFQESNYVYAKLKFGF